MADKVKVTVRGVTVKVDRDALDNIELLDALNELQGGNALVFGKCMRLAFGDKEYAKVKAALERGGITRASDMAEFFGEAMTAVNALEAKN